MLLTVLACSRSVPPAITPAPPATVSLPAASAPETTSAPADANRAQEGTSEPAEATDDAASLPASPSPPASLSGTPLEGWYEDYVTESDAIGAGLAATQSEAELLGLWRRGLVFTEALTEPLSAYEEATEYGPELRVPDEVVQALRARAPWMFMTYYAEGTVAAMELGAPGGEQEDDPWLVAAARTSGDTDDVLLALVYGAYGKVSPRGWATWHQREWDYGGCSPLGDGGGLHLSLLKLTDTLTGRPLAEDISTQIRAEVLADILQPYGPGEFPYCALRRADGLDGIITEANAIIAEVALTDAEKTAIQARIEAGFLHPTPSR